MKKIIYIVILVLLPIMALRAQDTNTHVYQSVFGDSLTEWDVLVTEVNLFNYDACSMRLLSDTMVSIGDSEYNYIRVANPSSSGCSLDNFNRIIRESEDHSKLYLNDYWAIYYGNYPDILLMDLSLEVGDTLDTSNWPPYDDPLHLGSFYRAESTPPTIRIDSIYYVDGRKILQTNYSHQTEFQNDTLLFIEGIGPSMGFTYATNRDDFLNFLLCYHRDGDVIVLDRHFGGNCHVEWSLGDIQADEDFFISLYPNPMRDILHIEKTELEPATLTIVSTDGRPMLQREVQDEHVKVDVSALPSGVYTLTIQNKQHSITKKIVKL
ncbi:MAG: T9SS type A sorting domain-containing protein [Bacteroidales bacterium]|nr:T9SS type A sorting domain-containing protein [Bacteroidales bacterium]